MDEKKKKKLKELEELEKLGVVQKEHINKILEELYKHGLDKTAERLSWDILMKIEEIWTVRGCIEVGPGLSLSIYEGDTDTEHNDWVKICPNTPSSVLVWKHRLGAPPHNFNLFILLPGERRVVGKITREKIVLR